METRLVGITASFEIVKAKIEREAATDKDELDTLRAKYKMEEARIKPLVVKDWVKLNQKIEKALAHGWKQWLAHTAELHVFQADAENRKKEGHGFNKMDKNGI